MPPSAVLVRGRRFPPLITTPSSSFPSTTPGVQHGGEADVRGQMLRVGGEGGQSLGGGPNRRSSRSALLRNATAPIAAGRVKTT